MSEICYGVVGAEIEASTLPAKRSSRVSRRRRMEIRQFKISSQATPAPEAKRQRVGISRSSSPVRPVQETEPSELDGFLLPEVDSAVGLSRSNNSKNIGIDLNRNEDRADAGTYQEFQKYGMTSVCGRRRDMEDAVSIHPSLSKDAHFYGVFDGHGCSHVAMRCKARMHEILHNEIGKEYVELDWKQIMERSFLKMDQEVHNTNIGGGASNSNCRCELRMPQCDAVGSTAVVSVVTDRKIIVSNCGDSRAVLCRNGVAIPLSSDHKPDRPDELTRIESAGGRVIYWDGARVLGVLAMSRAIGDSYLKPYVIPEPEVTMTERSDGDECLILASDGLWDVVSEETVCKVARMRLMAERPPSPPPQPAGSPWGKIEAGWGIAGSDKGCLDASILLTKLALARHSTDNVSVVVIDLRRDHHL